ncbi:hypothetical protein PMAYCL1PPCAC_10655, partial [Pristionchus mayeri]
TMMRLSFIFFFGVVSQVAAQCSTKENTNCVNFVKNGYCNNPGYTLAQKQATCGISCGLCTAAGVPVVAGQCAGDANANCASWAANGFCTNAAYSQAMIQSYCCKTCAAAPAFPTTDCAVLYEGASKEIAAPKGSYMVPIVNSAPLTKVFVKKGCKLTMITDFMLNTPATGSPFQPTADSFITLSGTATSTIGANGEVFLFDCTCL